MSFATFLPALVAIAGLTPPVDRGPDPGSCAVPQIVRGEFPYQENAKAARIVLHPGRATLDHDGDPWVWKGHLGTWVWKPGQFRATHDGGSTQYWWHWLK